MTGPTLSTMTIFYDVPARVGRIGCGLDGKQFKTRPWGEEKEGICHRTMRNNN